MSRILEALRQIESKRTWTPEVSSAPPTSRPPSPPETTLSTALGEDRRLRFSGPALQLPFDTSRPTIALPDSPVVLQPSPPEESVSLPPPALITPRRDLSATSQCVGQFDDRWFVTHSVIAPWLPGIEVALPLTLNTLTLQVIEPEPNVEEAKQPDLAVIQPSAAMVAKYNTVVDQLLGELRRGANHVLGLPNFSYAAYEAQVATNLGILLNQKKLGPVLVVEAPESPTILAKGSRLQTGRIGEPGLLEAMQGQPWQELIRSTAIEGVSLLHAGIQPLDMEDASIVASLESLWAELRAEFRFVLVSVPPGDNRVNEILLSSTDRIYVVMELGANLLAATQNTLRRWEELGGHAVGCIAIES